MGTSNFYYKNTKNVYAIWMNEYDEETGEFQEWIGDTDEEIDYFQEIFEDVFGGQFYCADNHDRERNFSGRQFGGISLDESFGDVTGSIDIQLIIRSGYYEGACFDYELSAGSNGDPIDGMEGFRDCLEQDLYYSDMNAGLKKIALEKICSKMEKALEETLKIVEETFGKLAGHTLKRVATFSNGETIYQEVTQ